MGVLLFFFFQAEDGIRDLYVTGVQTCALPISEAAIARDTANLISARKQVDLLKAEISQAVAASARASAVQRQAELNLSYTTITAPIDGVVGNRTLRTGQFVQAGTQLMSLV